MQGLIEIFHLLLHFPKKLNSQGRQHQSQKPRTQSSFPMYLSHHLLPPRTHISRKLELGEKPGFKSGMPSSALATTPHTCLSKLLKSFIKV